jgi:hypothetical protein
MTVLHVVPTFEPMQVGADLALPVQFVNPVSREEVLRQMRLLLENAGVSPDTHLVAQAGDPKQPSSIRR